MSQRQKRTLFSKKVNRPALDRPSSTPAVSHFQAIAQARARSAEVVDATDSARSSPSPTPQAHGDDAVRRTRSRFLKKMGSDGDLSTVDSKAAKKVPVKRGDSNDLDDYSKRHMQLMRSCSMDDLDKLAMTKEKRSSKTHTRGFDATRRRTSTESAKPTFTMTPPTLQRGVSTFRRDMMKNPKKFLYKPKSAEQLVEVLQLTDIDVNILDSGSGEAPLHAIIKRKRKERVDLILALMTHSKADINLKTKRGMTALHLAVQEKCDLCVKAVISFGASINIRGTNAFTAYDLAINNGDTHIEQLLASLGGTSSMELIKKTFKAKIPRLHSFAEHMHPPKKGTRLKTKDQIAEYINRQGTRNLFEELSANVNRRLSISQSIGGADDAYALVMQQRELALYNRTLPKHTVHPTGFGIVGGSRILCLDGGGIKGLVELEILMQIEEQTGQTIADLFDWIVGTSTGGIIALALVYAKRSLQELRQLFFLLKNRIFSKGRMGFGYNSEALEEILQEYFDCDVMMTDVTHPKVLIAAVNKATTNLELHFFNNCFGDEYCDFPVWKVARYTSAAPLYFSEVDDYVDGGVIANNPAEYGLSAIQNFYRLQRQKLPIAMVVSVGSGVYRAEKMGKVDAQEYLHFGKAWLKMGNLIKRTQNLFALLSNALVESEMVATNTKSRCEEQDIPYYRFSPQLDEIVSGGETDNEKLFNIIIRAKIETKEQGLDELVDLFRVVAERSKSLGKDVRKEELNTRMLKAHVSPPATTIPEEREELRENSREGPTSSPESTDEASSANRYAFGSQKQGHQTLSSITKSSLPDLEEEMESSRGSFVLESSKASSASKTLVQEYENSPTEPRKVRRASPHNSDAEKKQTFGIQFETHANNTQPRKASDTESPHTVPSQAKAVDQAQPHSNDATAIQNTSSSSNSRDSSNDTKPAPNATKSTGSLKLPTAFTKGHRRAKSADILDTEFKSTLEYAGAYSTMV